MPRFCNLTHNSVSSPRQFLSFFSQSNFRVAGLGIGLLVLLAAAGYISFSFLGSISNFAAITPYDIDQIAECAKNAEAALLLQSDAVDESVPESDRSFNI